MAAPGRLGQLHILLWHVLYEWYSLFYTISIGIQHLTGVQTHRLQQFVYWYYVVLLQREHYSIIVASVLSIKGGADATSKLPIKNYVYQYTSQEFRVIWAYLVGMSEHQKYVLRRVASLPGFQFLLIYDSSANRGASTVSATALEST